MSKSKTFGGNFPLKILSENIQAMRNLGSFASFGRGLAPNKIKEVLK
ncbi:hypothetical protein MR818_04805 [bacterium]|nr:hypothetical protein [bacterium]